MSSTATAPWPSEELRARYKELPHYDLHRHFVGGMRPERLAELARRYEPGTHLVSRGAVLAWWQTDNLDAFVERYIETINLVRACEDIENIAADLVDDLEQEGIVYAEVTYLPARFLRAHRLPFDEVADALRRGVSRNRGRERATVRFLMDMVRELPIEVGLSMIEAGRKYLGELIVGIDLGGREHRVPPGQFAEVYQTARRYGYRCVAHAGETAGASSIRGVLDDLQVDRIQHGVRCTEDEGLVRLLRERKTPLAVCPTSNVRLGIFPRYEDVPLRRLLDQELCVSLHTDDPGMFNTTLENEHAAMAAAARLSVADLEQLHRNAEAARTYRAAAETPLTKSAES